jgi:hypothetical protein
MGLEADHAERVSYLVANRLPSARRRCIATCHDRLGIDGQGAAHACGRLARHVVGSDLPLQRPPLEAGLGQPGARCCGKRDEDLADTCSLNASSILKVEAPA